jgi:hypothetical protein
MKRLLLPLLLLAATPALAQDFPPPEEIVAAIDTNRDGGIDRAEWAASPAPVPFPDQADTNMDNKIDVAELTALFVAFQAGGGQLPPPPPQQPAQPQTPQG